jgi:hypothetical protein
MMPPVPETVNNLFMYRRTNSLHSDGHSSEQLNCNNYYLDARLESEDFLSIMVLPDLRKYLECEASRRKPCQLVVRVLLVSIL